MSSSKNIVDICYEHKAKLTMQCTMCNKAICLICHKHSHRNHSVLMIDDFHKELKDEVNSVKMPYNTTNIDLFIKLFSEEEKLYLEELIKDNQEINKTISELVEYLNDLNHAFQLKFYQLRNDFFLKCKLTKQIFFKYYQDISTIQELDYNKLLYLNKLPKRYGWLKFKTDK